LAVSATTAFSDEGHRRHRGPDPVTDGVAAEGGPHRELLQVAHGGGESPRPEDLGELVRLVGRELPGDAIVGPEAGLNHGGGLDPLVEDDGELPADVAPGLARELVGRGGVEGEVDLGPVVLVYAHPGVLEVTTGDQRFAPQQIVEPLAGGLADAGEDLHVGGNPSPVRLEERLLARCGVLDEAELELGGGLDDPLCLLHVGDPGELHEDLVAGAAVAGDDGLRHPELVDAALERAHGLVDRPPREIPLIDVGHLDHEAVVASLPHTPAAAEVVAENVAHVLDPGRLDTLDREGVRLGALNRPELDAPPLGLLPGGEDRVVGGGLVRVLDHDLKDEVDAPAKVETQVDPTRLAASFVGRPDRHPAGDEEGAVGDGPHPELLAHEGVGEAGEAGGEQQPDDEGVLEIGGHHFSVGRPGSGWRPATALLRTLMRVLSSMRIWKASSSTPVIVPKMPEFNRILSPVLSCLTSVSSFFCFRRIGRMRTK
jgi:hypothetical protein